jgi:hypothetical protein
MKKIVFVSLFTFILSANAELCPRVEDIQHHRLGEWHVFNANSGEPLTPKEILAYEQKVRYFAEAAYYREAPEGPAQCYYDGEGEHYHLETYLARYGLVPDLSSGNWRDRGYGNYACSYVLKDCQFQKAQSHVLKVSNFSTNKAHAFW